MKIINQLLPLLKTCFQSMEKKFLSNIEKQFAVEFFELEDAKNIFVREYYDLGMRFLVQIREDKKKLSFYLRSEFIGGYKEKSLEEHTRSYIPLFSVMYDQLSEEKFLENMELVFNYMQKKEGEQPFGFDHIIEERKQKLAAFKKKMNPVIDVLDNSHSLYSSFKPYDSCGRNPFSLKRYDGNWFTRTYSTCILLFGERADEQKNTNKTYVFMNKSSLFEFTPQYGVWKEPRNLHLWTLVSVHDQATEAFDYIQVYIRSNILKAMKEVNPIHTLSDY